MELIEIVILADEFVELRERRLAADRAAKALKSEETVLAERLIHQGIENDTRFVGGSTHKVTIQTKSKPIAADWQQVYDYMIANDAMDLVQKRLTEGAVNARFEDGNDIPGIEFIDVNSLSVSKI